MKSLQVFLLIFLAFVLKAQSLKEKIEKLEIEHETLLAQQILIISKLEQLKLAKIRKDLRELGFPKGSESLQEIEHTSLVLGYNEKHEQPNWVTHIIIPDVRLGNNTRSNDFREDSSVMTGSASKDDYWYSGYDRGHLAPSADFRWSAQALSESYYYSNMSPQRPELNRERWAELENWTRSAAMSDNEQFIVVTGPVLHDNLPKIPQGSQRVSIPEFYYKVVLDLEGDEKKAIGFVMPNKNCSYPVISYAVSVDSVERLTGLNFFPNLEDSLQYLESNFDISKWEREIEGVLPDVAPLTNKEMPKNSINSSDAMIFINEKVSVCGTVVSVKKTKSGSVFLNLDIKFPNQIFSISIWDKDLKNFSYAPEIELHGKRICVTGTPTDYKGTPSMNINNEKKIKYIDEDY